MIIKWFYSRKANRSDHIQGSYETKPDSVSSESIHELPELGINHYAESKSDLERVKMRVQKNLENGESLITNELRKPKAKKRKRNNHRYY